MGITAALAMSVNAQTTIKIKNPIFKSAAEHSSTSKVSGVTQVAATISSNTQYIAGSTMDLSLTYQTSNTDLEYVDSLAITFPAGITPTGLANTSNPFPNTEDAGGGLEALNLPIAGQTVSWGINNNDTYGGIFASLGINFTVNVSITAGVSGPQTATFFASGDTYSTAASPAGDASGSFTIYPVGATVVNLQTKFVVPSNITALNNCAMTTHTILARVVNLGTNAETNIPANYSINGVQSTPIVILGPIAPGDSVTFGFPITYNFTPSNIYNIKAWVAQAGETALANDTAALTISNTIPTALTSSSYANGFETSYDVGSVNETVVGTTGAPFSLSGVNFHTGAQALFVKIPGTAPAGTYESIAILPCVDVTTGETYKVSYWKKAIASGTINVNGQTAVFTGVAQTTSAMTNVLKAYSPITTTTLTGTAGWVKDSVNFIATATETRYFAIGGKGTIAGANDQVQVRLDDVMITKTAGPVGIKTNSAAEAISIFPNPTSGVLNINAVEFASTMEVYNVIGEKVYSANLVKGNNNVDLSGLSNGAYFVKMNSNNQVITKKVVLSK